MGGMRSPVRIVDGIALGLAATVMFSTVFLLGSCGQVDETSADVPEPGAEEGADDRPPTDDRGPEDERNLVEKAKDGGKRLLRKALSRQHLVQCMNNVRTLAVLLENRAQDKDYPRFRGPNLFLYFVKRGDIQRHKDLHVLFCPGDERESAEKAGGPEAYTLAAIDLTEQKYDKLTSYAGRDQTDPACRVGRGEGEAKVLVCDDSDDHHDGKGIVVGLTGGQAVWRDKEEHYAGKDIVMGPDSEIEELKCMRTK